MHKAYIGTSGFMYKGWHGLFYPPEVKKEHLRFFATRFNTVEINSSFYRLPNESAFTKWHHETPDGFLFAIKLSRYITHIKRLKGVKRELSTFLERAQCLKEKFSVLLVQLPPSLKFDRKTVKKFLADLDEVCQRLGLKVKVALEPRHASWMGENTDEVRELMKKHHVALVFGQSAKYFSIPPEDENITSNFVYLRFHGPEQFASSLYGVKLLKPWAALAKKWLRSKPVYAYFNNDVHGYAVKDAATLTELLQKK